MNNQTTTLYRPVGPKELELIAASGYREFPPRLPDQPIFYPVLNAEYARQIARDWNVPASGLGYVVRFSVRESFAARYPLRTVGGSVHQELWVPAEDLPELNRNIVGLLEIIEEFTNEKNEGQMKRIHFYRVSEPYGGFSNFSPHPIEVSGRVWPTSEHYFQAQKFTGTEHEEAVRAAKSPMIAARMGRSRERPLRSDWESVKEEIMREALRAKFAQHSSLRSLLLSTDDAELVEHTKNDPYWGDGGDGSGKNRLGQLLMELRSELRRGLSTGKIKH